jgi:hypothetical protein
MGREPLAPLLAVPEPVVPLSALPPAKRQTPIPSDKKRTSIFFIILSSVKKFYPFPEG